MREDEISEAQMQAWADEAEALDAIASRDQVSRSEAIRRALAQLAA